MRKHMLAAAILAALFAPAAGRGEVGVFPLDCMTMVNPLTGHSVSGLGGDGGEGWRKSNAIWDGKVIRLAVPPLSQERREQLASRVKALAEEARIAIRNIRRDANRHLDREQKESLISEDDCRRAKEQVQELTDRYEEKVAETLDRKTQDIMKV